MKSAILVIVTATLAGFLVIVYLRSANQVAPAPKSQARSHESMASKIAAKETLVASKFSSDFQGWLDSGIEFQPRTEDLETSGFNILVNLTTPWKQDATLSDIAAHYDGATSKIRSRMDTFLTSGQADPKSTGDTLILKAATYQMDGFPEKAYAVLGDARKLAQSHPVGASLMLFPVIYLQGVAALRMGENANCVMCRGESSCILPIQEAAVHKNEQGSRLAIKHFTEYLAQFPDDTRVEWLLNLAHMTLGEYPEKVDSRYLVSLDKFLDTTHSLGKFVDVGSRLGINRFNQAGGAIMDDFDNDGLLDIIFTSYDARVSMAVLKNTGSGKFENIIQEAGATEQLGGLNCVQTDFNNDGLLDIFVVRGAWYYKEFATRPSLLQNMGNLQFKDVTEQAGMMTPINSIAAQWADYDNDGWLDLLIACERQRNRLYHNKKDGTFEEVAEQAGLAGEDEFFAKGLAWIDYNNDGFQDVFINNLLTTGGQFYINNHDGTFRKATEELGLGGPELGFSCWSWDYDNDGYLDILATSYQSNLSACVDGLIGKEQSLATTKLFRNQDGKKFIDVTEKVGLDLVLFCMGSNFGDFDGDGYLDFYLGTGEPDISSLVPNRMFRNLDGKEFVDVSASSGTAHLQKGHGISCGDWDNDGAVDILIEMGGAIDGDRFHNLMFQNPNKGIPFIKLKLHGVQSNKAAIGTRITVFTDDKTCPVIHRTVSSGSSFGANPLTSTIGLNEATKVTRLEINWPATGKTQTFDEVALNQYFEITEDDTNLKPIDLQAIPLPPQVSMDAAMKSSRF